MSKTAQEARTFFNKTVLPKSDFTEGFESESSIHIPTIAIPITIDLTEQEKRNIQKILVDDYQPGRISESQVAEHVEQLTNITKQIKSISSQSVLLHGERIKQAQELLSDYKDGAFTKWLMSTYGNRQTPYSMLRYYEFYTSAPIESRALIEAAPKKAVYLLASRDGDEGKKLKLIREHGTSSQSDLLLLIQETFPTMETDKRKPMNASTIEAMGKLCLKLESRSKQLTENDRIEIEDIIRRLQKL
jgi:hypothetical protein